MASADGSVLAAISQALDSWRQVGFTDRRKTLDESVDKIADNNTTAVEQRKGLAEATRSFKRDASEDTKKDTADLIRKYQEAVDSLTKRSRFAEGLFLEFYKSLCDAPDPVNCLRDALNCAQASAKIGEAKELEKDLETKANEIKTLKKELLRLKDGFDEALREQLEEERAEIEEEYEGRLQAADETRTALTDKLQAVEEELFALRQKNGAVQATILSTQSSAEEVEAARLAELEVVSAELERSVALVADLQARLDDQNAHGEGANMRRAELEEKVERLREMLNIAQAEAEERASEAKAVEVRLHTAIDSFDQERDDLLQRLEIAHSEKSELEDTLRDAKAELEARPTTKSYAELQQRLKTLERVEYNAEDDDQDDQSQNTETPRSAEDFLVHKLRRIETKLMKSERSLKEKSEECKSLRETILEHEQKISSQGEIISQLEDGVLKKGSGSTRVTGADVLEKFAGGTDAEAKESGGEYVDVLVKQRDRFKGKVEDLEAERAHLKSAMDRMRRDLETATADNVKLYERAQFLQSMQNKGGVKRPAGRDIEGGSADFNDSKYKDMYENSIDPFTEFTKKQRAQKKANMNVVEKLTLSVGEVLYGNQAMRFFMFAYTMLLHFLVFFTLYHYAFHHAGGNRKLPPGSVSTFYTHNVNSTMAAIAMSGHGHNH